MKTLTLLGVALALVVGLATVSSAAEKTITGSIMCAKCTLKKADAKECQDVLVAKDDQGTTTECLTSPRTRCRRSSGTPAPARSRRR